MSADEVSEEGVRVHSSQSPHEWLSGQRFVRFPPRMRNVLVPVGPASATARGVTLYAPSRWLPLAAQDVLWTAARVGGGRLLPGEHEPWASPFDRDTFDALWRTWQQTLGRPIDGLAVYERPQHFRTNTMLLLCAGRASAVIRLHRDPTHLDLEIRVSRTAAQLAPHTFEIPPLIGVGRVDDWHWAGFRMMSSRPHRAVRRLPPRLLPEIGRLVELVVPRTDDVPAHWRPAHGDLTPWNLRRVHGKTWLIDWEDAGWAPPGTDEVYFRATAATLGRHPDEPLRIADEHREAADRLARRVAARPVQDRLGAQLATLLTGRANGQATA